MNFNKCLHRVNEKDIGPKKNMNWISLKHGPAGRKAKLV